VLVGVCVNVSECECLKSSPKRAESLRAEAYVCIHTHIHRAENVRGKRTWVHTYTHTHTDLNVPEFRNDNHILPLELPFLNQSPHDVSNHFLRFAISIIGTGVDERDSIQKAISQS
jgi:hypothetical protein